MKLLTIEQHKKRLENLREAEESVISCMKQHRIRDYVQGHVMYRIGEYPYPFKIEPTEYDYHVLHECATRGAGIIQLHEEWNDALRIMGADKYTSHDPEGLSHFLNLCHSMQLKVMAYASMGYMQITDPDYRESYNLAGWPVLRQLHYSYGRNDPSNPEWVNYIMPKMEKMLELYDFDGLYNDMECGDFSGVEEMFSEVYSMLKARKRLYKVHVGGKVGLPLKEKLYDYIATGEAVVDVKSGARMRNLTPYVTPIVDYRHQPDDDPDFVFAQFIPFMQFPMLFYGRPVKGLMVEAPGVAYTQESRYWLNKRVGQYYNFHKDGPYVYSEWSSIPSNPLMKDKWFEYLALYKPMTEEDTVCRLNIGENALLKSEIPEDVYVSLFTNERQYLVISNLSDKPYEAVLSRPWFNRVARVLSDRFVVPPHRIIFLKKEREGVL